MFMNKVMLQFTKGKILLKVFMFKISIKLVLFKIIKGISEYLTIANGK